VSKKYHRDRVLNPIRRRIFRSRITRTENVVAAALVVVIVLAGAWVLAQHDNFDPADRDISIEALRQGSIAQLPYEAPFKSWREPGAEGPAPALDLGPFPATLLAGGWQVDGRVETYDPSNLYEKINGQAEQYLSFGFRELDYVTLEKEGRYLTLEMYDQAEFKNALGVFASQRDPDRDVERRGAAHYYPTSVGAIGLTGPRFFKITGSEAHDSIGSKSDQLLGMLGEMPGDTAGSDAAFSILADRLDLPFERISFVKQNALQYDFLGETWFGALGEGPDDAQVFLHRVPEGSSAAELFARLVEEQSFEFTPVESTGDRAMMRHEFLGTFFAAAHRGDWLYGVDGAPDAAAAGQMLQRLGEELL
jgi:hypothetical protein